MGDQTVQNRHAHNYEAEDFIPHDDVRHENHTEHAQQFAPHTSKSCTFRRLCTSTPKFCSIGFKVKLG